MTEKKPPDLEHLYTSSLIPYARNTRTHSEAQVAQIAASIREFGFTNPVLVKADRTIIAGHGRVLAAQSLGMEKVPCLVLDYLTDAQAKALAIADNKIPLNSGWDAELLKLEMEELREAGLDMSLLAFNENELALMFGETGPGAVVEDDGGAVAALDSITTCIKRGDLIQLGQHRLLCGDSTSAEDVGALLDGAKPFIMVTDPSYGVEYDPEWRNEAAEKGALSFAARREGMVANDHRADWTETYKLFPGDVAYVWHASFFTIDVGLHLREAGFTIRSSIIWRKPSFAISRGHYHWQHEPCWYAVRDGKTAKWSGDRSQSTIWEINKHDGTGNTVHGTQKPLECMARPIRNHGTKDDDVFDPFLGSGTTLIACEAIGRRCFGLELEPKYCQVIIDRYRAFCEKNRRPCEIKINGERYERQEADTAAA